MVLKRIGLGVGLFVLAVAVVLTPSADLTLPFPVALRIAVGLAVVGAGLIYLIPKEGSGRASPPVPEEPADLPSPGEAVEEQLAVLAETPLRPAGKRKHKETHTDVKSRLRSLTIRTLKERYNLNEREATELVDSGRWSDDSHAVAFFADAYSGDAPSLIRLRPNAGGSRIGKQARHVIDELGAIERDGRLLPEKPVEEEEYATDRAAESQAASEGEST